MPPRPGRHPELPVPVSRSACPYAEPGVPRRRGEAFPEPSRCLVLVASRGAEAEPVGAGAEQVGADQMVHSGWDIAGRCSEPQGGCMVLYARHHSVDLPGLFGSQNR